MVRTLLLYTGNDSIRSLTDENINCKIKTSKKQNSVSLQCSPLDGFDCTSRFWKITVDVFYTNIEPEGTSHQRDITFSSEGEWYPLIKIESVEAAIIFDLSNIRTIGIRKFPKRDFENPDPTADLTISHKNKNFYCHSQVLSLNSNVISEMITRKYELSSPVLLSVHFGKPPLKIDLSFLIPLDDLVELLHYIYFPIDVIDEINFETLLHWSYTFNVTSILHKCINRMDSEWESSLMDHDRSVELFLLSWKYNFKTKVDYFNRVFSPSICIEKRMKNYLLDKEEKKIGPREVESFSSWLFPWQKSHVRTVSNNTAEQSEEERYTLLQVQENIFQSPIYQTIPENKKLRLLELIFRTVL